MSLWSNLYGYLFGARQNKPPRRALETQRAQRQLQLQEKGTDQRERGLNTQVTPPMLPYDRWAQRWNRKKLIEEVNQYAHTDPRLARAEEKVAQKAIGMGVTITVQGAQGRSRTARMSREAQDVINQLLRETRMNAWLKAWVRYLKRYGELDLNVIVDQSTRRVVEIRALPSLTIMRNEDEFGRFPDLDRAFTQVDPLHQLPIVDPVTGQHIHFPLYAMNVIRWHHDPGELYGTSAYAPGLKHAQLLPDMEWHVYVRRMVRAGLKWIFSFFRSDGTPVDWNEVEKFKEENKQALDPKNLREAVVQNFYSNSQAKVEGIQGDAKLDEMDDVKHFEDQLWLAAGMPKGLLGYGEGINRDVLKEQQEELNADLDAICFLLEHGDGSVYSGLRAIIDFQLALQGINPEAVSYNMQWTQHTTETKKERLDYVKVLRQDLRLVPKRMALHLLSNDLGLETEADIDAVLAELEEEAPQGNAPPGTGDGRFLTPDDLPAAGDAPEEDLAPVRARMQKLLRDRGRRAWRRVQKHPELRPLLESIVTQAKRAQKIGIPVPTTTFHDSAGCSKEHGAFSVDDGESDLPGQTPYLLALIKGAMEEEGTDSLRPGYLAAAREGAKEAAVQAGVKYPGLPKAFTTAFSDRYTARWTGDGVDVNIDGTTEGLIKAQMRSLFDSGAEVAAWEQAVADVLSLSTPGRLEAVTDGELCWAYHQGALHVFRDSGVELVQRHELPTCCPDCAAHNGDIHRVEEAADILPAHAHCYGWWEPVE